MTSQEIWIGILSGVLVNIVTGVVTYLITARRDQSIHERETKARNAQVAEIALNHLNSSYLASKRLRSDLLAHMRTVRDGEVSPDVFAVILDGVARSIEQNRISILGNMLDWKHYVTPDSELSRELARMRTEELAIAHVGEPPRVATETGRARRRESKSVGQPQFDKSIFADLDKMGQSPRERLARALMADDLDSIREILQERLDAAAPVQQIVLAATALCRNGEADGADAIGRLWATRRSELKADDISAMLGAYVAFCESTDAEAAGIPFAGELASAALESEKSQEERAIIHNQLGKLNFGAEQYTEALSWTEKAAALNVNDAAYPFNLSVIYEAVDDLEKAESSIRKCLDLDGGEADLDHMAHAVEIFAKVGKTEDALTILSEIKSRDVLRARMVLMDDDVRHPLEAASAGRDGL